MGKSIRGITFRLLLRVFVIHGIFPLVTKLNIELIGVIVLIIVEIQVCSSFSDGLGGGLLKPSIYSFSMEDLEDGLPRTLQKMIKNA